ncbi:MAG: ABC transporter ATP-binding protein [Clostridium sp.]|uniref:ABC transporter ATP-binding protein n=1 Tax=Clostridium sp. TaxID=1506 RepID=UPI002915AEE0|nr:ABC transporter ATP-binding protein [Clostridium sp.]MDU7337668.1 ABC transporter ATP-binding protein [Clostridium sp.]
MKKILSGKGIVKTYGKGKKTTNALNHVDIEVFAGEFIAVMGPSGCGKSTLLFALSGTDTINDGIIEFDGQELSKRNEDELADIRRTQMGFVFQQPTMLKNLNVLDNIILSSLQEQKGRARLITQKAKRLMQETGISGLEDRDITEVSGGQLQRAGICRALMNDPQILFADEPTGALNSKSSDEIMGIFSAVNKKGTAVLLVTHDARVASRAERVLFMKDGKMESLLSLEKFEEHNIENRIHQILLKMRDFDI